MSAGSATTGHTTTKQEGTTMSDKHTVTTTIAPVTEVEVGDAEYQDLKAWGAIKSYVKGPEKKPTPAAKKEN